MGSSACALLLGAAQEPLGAELGVGLEGQLVGHRVGDHRRVVARGLHGALHLGHRPLALEREPEQVRAVVALPHRRLVPHHDPRAVEPAQQPLAEHVVRARGVGAQLLELAHDRVEVGAGEGGAVADHVLVQRGAAQLDAAVVEVQQAALDLHRAQPDVHPPHLLDPASVGERHRGPVEVGALGRPQLGRGHRHLALHLAAATGRAR